MVEMIKIKSYDISNIRMESTFYDLIELLFICTAVPMTLLIIGVFSYSMFQFINCANKIVNTVFSITESISNSLYEDKPKLNQDLSISQNLLDELRTFIFVNPNFSSKLTNEEINNQPSNHRPSNQQRKRRYNRHRSNKSKNSNNQNYFNNEYQYATNLQNELYDYLPEVVQ